MLNISLATWVLLVDALAVDTQTQVARESATVPAARVEDAAKKVEDTAARSDLSRAAVVPVRVDARNQMGKRFRLVEARFVLGGQEVARLHAAPGQELDLASRPIQALLGHGEHALTAVFTYQGRNVGLFSYLGNYRYRVEQTYSFYLEPGQSAVPVIQVVASERGGMMIPLEKKPTMAITSVPGLGVTPMAGITHATEVTVSR